MEYSSAKRMVDMALAQKQTKAWGMCSRAEMEEEKDAFKVSPDCLAAETHKIKADKARSLYKNDAESNVDNTKFSVDLQKVVMIPQMPDVKQ